MSSPVAIITGAGQPVGAAIARTLAALGVRVALNDLNPDRLEQVSADILAAGGEAVTFPTDPSNKFQAAWLVDSTRSEWGRLDLLINALQVAPRTPLLTLDEWEWQRCLELNLKAPFLMSQFVARVFAWELAQRDPHPAIASGLILNIASTLGVSENAADHAVFATASAGLVGFTRACALEMAPFGGRANGLLLPGVGNESADPTLPARAAARIAWLCSPAAAALNGQMIALEEREDADER